MSRQNYKFFITGALALILFNSNLYSQKSNVSDSGTNMTYLPEITLVESAVKREVVNLPEIVGTQVYAGKKNALLILDNMNTVVVNNTMRQIFARIPGITIWESDGSGIQIGVAARGLSPNRSWEFNVRQNGCDIAADPFGYPEAYYNPQMQAVQRIQVVRGAGSLQYGPQFGGMINYIMRDGSDIHKSLQLETQQTAGSFGLLNSFVALGGEKGKLHYYAFFDSRKADGWRHNSRYMTRTGFGSVTYRINSKMRINAEYMNYTMESQQPGGLTDAQFAADPRLSSRARNWFSTPWVVASIKYDWEISSRSRFQAKVYTVSGDRSSVGFLAPINVKDSINKTTSAYNNREVAIDKYRNYAFEAGYLRDYMLFKKKQTLSAGVRYFNGNTFRFQKGKGSTGSDADYSIATATFPTDVTYNSVNYAAFAENVFRIGKKLLAVPGFRVENIAVSGYGRLSYDNNNNENRMTPETRTRTFVLGGIGFEYHLGKKHHTEIYANYTQAYRPILFSNITSPTTDVVDPNMKDSRGWNADLGFRGAIGNLMYIDAGVYYLQYNDRIGSVSRLNDKNETYKYVSNLGNSHSYGLESVVDMDPITAFAHSFARRYGSLPVFVSYNYNTSEYEKYLITAVVNNAEVQSDLKGKKVEYAPAHILRAGISYKHRNLHLTFQLSHTSESFSDANNTVAFSANAQTGLIPAYTVYDLMGTYRFNEKFNIKVSLNNISNAMYFTRRAGGYPGPGILPSDGRSLLVSVGARL